MRGAIAAASSFPRSMDAALMSALSRPAAFFNGRATGSCIRILLPVFFLKLQSTSLSHGRLAGRPFLSRRGSFVMQIPFAKRRLQAPGCGICIALPDMQPSSCRFLFPRKSRFYPLPSRGKNPSANVPALLPGYVLPHHKHYTKHLFACKVCESICPGGSFPFSSRGPSWLGTGICLFFSPDTPQDGVFFLLLFPIRIGLCPSFKRMFPVFTQSRPCFLSFREKGSFCRKSGTPVRGVVIFPQILYPYGASDRCS